MCSCNFTLDPARVGPYRSTPYAKLYLCAQQNSCRHRRVLTDEIAATTLGETGGDAVTMSMDLGYLTGTLIFAAIFLAAVVVQIRHRSFNKWIYWFTVIATTTLADFADRSSGIGYLTGTVLLSIPLVISLLVRRVACGTIEVDSVNNVRTGNFYGMTIMFSCRLDGRQRRLRLRRRHPVVRRRAGDYLAGKPLYDGLTHRAVLGRVYPHPSAWRGGG